MFDRKLSFGVYEATEDFRKIKEHSCVCYEDDLGLVAVTGLAGDEESEKYAELFAAAPEMLEALETINKFWVDPNFDGNSTLVIEKMRNAMIKINGHDEGLVSVSNSGKLDDHDQYPNWMINERDDHERHEANE